MFYQETKARENKRRGTAKNTQYTLMRPIEYRLTVPNFDGVQNGLVLRLDRSYVIGAINGARASLWTEH